MYDGKEYYVHVRSQCNSLGIGGISDWATASFRTFPVSVADVDNKNWSISLFPNPAHGDVTINVNGIGKDAMLSVVDVSGRVLMHQPVVGKENVITTQRLAAGIYLLKYSDSSHTEILRFVKQ